MMRRTRPTPTPASTDMSATESDIASSRRQTRNQRQRATAELAYREVKDRSTPTSRNAKLVKGTRRPHVRQSLTGALIGEMSIDRRAEMVSDVAGDCLVKLLKAGVTSGKSTKKQEEMEWRKAWEGLQSQLFASYIDRS
jgi:hypothetical protein